MNKKETYGLSIRYLILVLIAIPNLYILYKIFTPLTVYPAYLILKFLYNATLLPENVILLKGHSISLIPACIAGAAYYLLLILNLTTPMSIKKRTQSLILILSSFLIINILRIIIFASLFTSGFKYFNLTHEITWYIGSTILVVLIWFSNVRIFKITSIPILTDLKKILNDIK